MPFLIREDKALRAKLQGLTVTDLRAGSEPRPVGVWFRFPQRELREAIYPFMVIDLVGIDRAAEREHRGPIPISTWYIPEGVTVQNTTSATTLITEYPIPVWLTYIVTTYARFPEHDRQIQAQLLERVLPIRWGYLEIPEDNTIRRFDVIGVQPTDVLDANDHTVFRKLYTLRVSAELFTEEIRETLEARTSVLTLTAGDITETDSLTGS